MSEKKKIVINMGGMPIPKEVFVGPQFISSQGDNDHQYERKGPRFIMVDDINDTAAVEAAMEEMWKYIPHKSHSVTWTNES